MLFETLEHNVHLILAAFMLPRFTHVCVYLFIVEERILMHPAVHVGLGSACVYIPPLPPTSGPGNVFASRGLCLIVAHLLLSRTFANKDAFTVLPE
jgi:hypothetical protein